MTNLYLNTFLQENMLQEAGAANDEEFLLNNFEVFSPLLDRPWEK